MKKSNFKKMLLKKLFNIWHKKDEDYDEVNKEFGRRSEI